MARAGVEHVDRQLGAGDRRSPGVEAEVIEKRFGTVASAMNAMS